MLGLCAESQGVPLTGVDDPTGGSIEDMENENKKERRESRLSSKTGSNDCRASKEEQKRNQAAGIMDYPCVDSYTSPFDCSPFSGKQEREAYYYGKTPWPSGPAEIHPWGM